MDRERPLDDHELRIVRGMIDEHEYERNRRRFLGEVFGDARTVILTLVALGQGVADVLILRGH